MNSIMSPSMWFAKLKSKRVAPQPSSRRRRESIIVEVQDDYLGVVCTAQLHTSSTWVWAGAVFFDQLIIEGATMNRRLLHILREVFNPTSFIFVICPDAKLGSPLLGFAVQNTLDLAQY